MTASTARWRRIADYLRRDRPRAGRLRPRATGAALDEIERTLGGVPAELREYTLRVMRADSAAGALVRERIQASARTTALISVAAVLISVLSLFLILRENRRQRELAR